jgi:predicted transcriptional regulator
MPKSLQRPLTEVELELMRMIWTLGECTIREVHSALPKERDLAYTTVATMIKILEQKGVLAGYKKERAHLFVPTISREDYERQSLKHLSDNLFQGKASSMVSRLLDDGDLSEEELRSIKNLLDQRMRS